MHTVVARLPARGECGHAGFLAQGLQQPRQPGVGAGCYETVFFKHIAAVGQHRGLGAKGQAIQARTGARQVAFGSAHQADVLQIARYQVAHRIVGVGQACVFEKRLQRRNQLLFNVLALPGDDVGHQVETALGLGHFGQLHMLHAQNVFACQLHLDAGVCGELRQQLLHHVVMRVVGDAERHRLPSEAGIAVIRAGTGQGQGTAENRKRTPAHHLAAAEQSRGLQRHA